MKIVSQSYEILSDISEGGLKELELIEKAARTCYKSEEKASEDGESAKRMIKSLIAHVHEAMLEHSSLTVKFITNRAIANEFVRHRLCSFAQESTRYCNYSLEEKFGSEITVVVPDNIDEHYKRCMMSTWKDAEFTYIWLIEHGAKPEIARDVLPLATKTELVVTANYREWRHILKLRALNETGPAHPMIHDLCTRLLLGLKERIPIIFDDLEVDNDIRA